MSLAPGTRFGPYEIQAAIEFNWTSLGNIKHKKTVNLGAAPNKARSVVEKAHK